jgi:hypothetical protein
MISFNHEFPKGLLKRRGCEPVASTLQTKEITNGEVGGEAEGHVFAQQCFHFQGGQKGWPITFILAVQKCSKSVHFRVGSL